MRTHTPRSSLIGLLAIFAIVGLSVAPALATCTGRLGGDVAFVVGLPQDEMSDNVDNTGIGGHLNFGISFERLPFFVGVNFGALGIGSEERKEPFSTTIPDVTVDVKTNHNIVYGHLLLRLQPPGGAVRPFLDGLVGFKNFYTKTRIESEASDDDEPIAESKNADDTALSYGLGGGLQVRVYRQTVPCGADEKHAAEEGQSFEGASLNVYVTAGAWYLFGGEAEYLKEGSIRRENGQVIYDLSKSNTDMLMAYLGVTVSYPMW